MSDSLFPAVLDNITGDEHRNAPSLASVLNNIQSTIGVEGHFNFGQGTPGVYNALLYGVEADGTTDDTVAWNALFLTIAAAGGGTALLPAGKRSLCLGALTPMPFGSGAANPPLRITGGGGFSQAWLTNVVGGASILDLRYAGSGPAKIDCRGIGRLEIDHLSLISGGTDDWPFFQTTNTNVYIHDNWISGHSANTGSSCVQDAFVMGGPTTGSFPYGLQTGASYAPFQGYLSVIERNTFDKIRTGILLRSAANDLVLSANLWGQSCGGDSTHGAIMLYDPTLHPTSNILSGNIIELTNYVYGIYFGTSADHNVIVGTGLADPGSSTLTGGIFDAAGNIGNAPQSPSNIVAVSGNYTALPGDVVLGSSGSYTITLPQPNQDYQVTAKKVSSGGGTIAITPSSGLVDGAAFLALTTQYQSFTVIADGTNWNVI